MKIAVVSGATGFLGGHTVKRLASEGWLVYALTRSVERAKVFFGDNKNIVPIEYSFGKSAQEQLSKHIEKADLFIHTAWAGVNRDDLDNPTIQEKNVEYSLDILNFAIEKGIKNFVDYGSRAEYGNATGTLIETQDCVPANNYGKAKLRFYNLAKQLCLEHNINYLHLRFFSVFGKYDHPWSLMSTLGEKLPNGEAVQLGACVQKWNLLPISDAVSYVSGLVDLLLKNKIKSEIINIASKDTRVLRDYIESANSLFGNKSELRFGEFIPLKDSVNDVIPSVEKLLSFVKIDEIGFEKGFLEMVENK